jgi:hypothetical protein
MTSSKNWPVFAETRHSGQISVQSESCAANFSLAQAPTSGFIHTMHRSTSSPGTVKGST